jgi:hypothetical protein
VTVILMVLATRWGNAAYQGVGAIEGQLPPFASGITKSEYDRLKAEIDSPTSKIEGVVQTLLIATTIRRGAPFLRTKWLDSAQPRYFSRWGHLFALLRRRALRSCHSESAHGEFAIVAVSKLIGLQPQTGVYSFTAPPVSVFKCILQGDSVAFDATAFEVGAALSILPIRASANKGRRAFAGLDPDSKIDPLVFHPRVARTWLFIAVGD